MDITESIHRAAAALVQADAVLITAGAGMGVDSGLPDFRGNQGFWKAYPPIARLGLSFSEMANPMWFERNAPLAWGFYGHRLNLYRQTVPHAGFRQLLELVNQKKDGYFVFTSNVDGHFQDAGFDEERIAECHGSIHFFQCCQPCHQKIWDGRHTRIVVDEETLTARDPLPRCPKCGSVARPNILMFGDWAWISDRTDRQSQHLQRWLQELTIQKLRLVVIEIGAGESVPTVRMKSEHVARTHKALLIRINPRDYRVPHGQIALPLGAAEAIERIYRAIREGMVSYPTPTSGYRSRD